MTCGQQPARGLPDRPLLSQAGHLCPAGLGHVDMAVVPGSGTSPWVLWVPAPPVRLDQREPARGIHASQPQPPAARGEAQASCPRPDHGHNASTGEDGTSEPRHSPQQAVCPPPGGSRNSLRPRPPSCACQVTPQTWAWENLLRERHRPNRTRSSFIRGSHQTANRHGCQGEPLYSTDLLPPLTEVFKS